MYILYIFFNSFSLFYSSDVSCISCISTDDPNCAQNPQILNAKSCQTQNNTCYTRIISMFTKGLRFDFRAILITVGILSKFSFLPEFSLAYYVRLDGNTIRGCSDELDQDVLTGCKSPLCQLCTSIDNMPGCNNKVITRIFGLVRIHISPCGETNLTHFYDPIQYSRYSQTLVWHAIYASNPLSHQIVPKQWWTIRLHAKFTVKTINVTSIKQVNSINFFSFLRICEINPFFLRLLCPFVGKTFERGCFTESGSMCKNRTQCYLCTGNGCNLENGDSPSIPIAESTASMFRVSLAGALIVCMVTLKAFL